MTHHTRPHLLLTLGLLASLACGGDASTGVTSDDLTFLSAAAGAPSIASSSVAFWAVKGQDHESIIWYRATSGRPDSSKLARFRLDRRSLCNRVDGSAMADGDSLRITMTVIDPVRLEVKFEPAGLQFCSGRPAKLNLWWEHTSRDYDKDGDVDAADAALEATFSIWKRETLTSPWIKLTSLLRVELDEAEAELVGFTSYLVAY
ncbi:MAG: hypothetical protein IPK85_10585 [Gemmatimonadetes bacterium]|nr:hypothetical protein [Gemmatimonadota bacterium]